MTIRTLIVAAIASLCFTGTGLAQTVADFFPEQKLTASDGAVADFFGESVAISGDTALVGAHGDDDNGSSSGSAYIYERQADGSWSETSKLTASDAAATDYFGISVAISGDTALVGAYGDEDDGPYSGSAYLYQRQGDGTWSEIQKLTASDAAALDYFGSAVAISGDTALVGAYGDSDNGSNSGSAYIFEQQLDGTWSEVAKLTASDAAAYDFFGDSVAISGDTALVGAHYDDDNGNRSGSAYIHQRQADGSWSEIQKLTASDGAEDDIFGGSVTISGETALVGARGDDDNGSNSGSAYIFEQQLDGTWSEFQKLTASDGANVDYFGRSVAISGDTALVDAYADDDNGVDSGSAYVYDINSIINLDYWNFGYNDLTEAVAEASPDDRLAVRSFAFEDGFVNLGTKPLNFIAVESCSIPDQMTMQVSSGTTFSFSNDIDQAGLNLVSRGTLYLPAQGEVTLDTDFYGTDDSVLFQNGATLLGDNYFASWGSSTAYLSGTILADTVWTNNGAQHIVYDDTMILGDYFNQATTVVHRGTLHITGDLSGSGTMLGDVDTGPGLRGGDLPSPGDGFSIGGSSALGASASLRMLDFDWTLGIGGDVDWAINDPSRFVMSGATLSLTGLASGVQVVELMSADQGAVETTDFEIGTLRVEPGTVVTLVDTHDNADDGDASCEALYAGTIVVEAGASLLTNGCPVYAREAIIKGELDGDVIIIGESCQGDEDGDGTVDVLDLLAVISAWGDCNEDCSADFDSNGTVDVIDLLIVIQYWGTCGD